MKREKLTIQMVLLFFGMEKRFQLSLCNDGFYAHLHGLMFLKLFSLTHRSKSSFVSNHVSHMCCFLLERRHNKTHVMATAEDFQRKGNNNRLGAWLMGNRNAKISKQHLTEQTYQRPIVVDDSQASIIKKTGENIYAKTFALTAISLIRSVERVAQFSRVTK